MVLSVAAVRGAVGFLTRIPVGHDEAAWDAWVAAPAAMVPVGYLVGAVLSLPFVVGGFLALPSPVVAFAALGTLIVVTGITHLDGVADCADAAIVHGTHVERREVLKDTVTGVGALAGVGLVLVGLGLGFLAVAGLPLFAGVAVVLASEVGAKAAMAIVAATETAPHEGFGSALTEGTGRSTQVAAVALSLPVLGVGGLQQFVAVGPSPGDGTDSLISAAVCLLAALGVALLARRWARTRLGGVNGDVFGATNELARIAGLHLGVVAWTLW
ncbi:adenosylcobinamide-GDP ribazoletransferase [Haloarchaeobius sp. TZWWS8]|uniref:adenosylcobinamide-GDP ribazoletransferase n=1 Tax=Haloarchaeobius sp. TZWWS8 TaxID=3446121 RepID=UPI003EBE9914